MNHLLQFDADLLVAINSHHSPFWDQVMWYASQSWTWIPLYLLFICAIVLLAKSIKKSKSPVRVRFKDLEGLSVAAIAIAAGLSDFVTSGILKKWICRPRPTHSDLAPLLHLVNGYTGGQYGFPSSHAANTVAVATSFLMIFYFLKRQAQPLQAGDFRQVAAVRFAERALLILVLLYVLLNCYSRMYLGVHYPLDILTGALIGLLFGYLLARLFQYTANRFLINGRTQ